MDAPSYDYHKMMASSELYIAKTKGFEKKRVRGRVEWSPIHTNTKRKIVPAGGRDCPEKFELTQACDGPPVHVTSPKPSQTETTGLEKVGPSSTSPHTVWNTDKARFMTSSELPSGSEIASKASKRKRTGTRDD